MPRLAAMIAGAAVVVATFASGASSAAVTMGTLTVQPEIGAVKTPYVFTGTECFDTGTPPTGSLELFHEGVSVLVRDDLFPDANGVWTDGIAGTYEVAGTGVYRLEARCESGGYDYEPVTFESVSPEILYETPTTESAPAPAAEPLRTDPAFTG